MSRNDEPLTVAGIRMAADLTYEQHQPHADGRPGFCRQCTSTGCPQLTWALSVREGGEAAYPVARPKSPVPLLLAAANATLE